MKKNGFTLIELIASVTILALIALIAFPNILNALKKGQDKVDAGVKRVVESAAESYYNDKPDIKQNYTVYVTVCDLAKNGYISVSFFEKNQSSIGQGRVKITPSGSKYTYEFLSTGGDSSCSLS